MAVGGSAPVPTGPASRSEIVRNFASWLGLFGITAAFHAAEKAIDNLYPWKLRQFAEEEGPSSPFARLLEDILGFQFTILMTTTACTIFSANMFVGLMSQLFGSTGAAYSSTVLTILTIFFAELIPKAIGVSNPELSARLMVRPINFASSMLKPVSFLFTSLSTLLLKFVGLEISEDEGQDVSEEMLKMMILGARSSGGIQKEEGKMMQSVLRLEDMSCNQIMRPRVDVVAIDKSESLGDLLQLSIDSRCARIPVFQGDIDNIIGIAKLKNVLKYLAAPGNSLNATVEEILEPERDKPFFVYEASAAWDVLQEMRKKRHHMGVVVDEHGGTSGIITMEDLIEEVVGDIYDEDELEDLKDDDAMILWDADQQRYLISGAADLREIDSGLRLCIDEETFSSFASFSGWVCDEAGRIPKEGDYLLVSKYILKVLEADERRVLRLSVEEMSEDEEEENAGDREKEKERQSGGPSLSIVGQFVRLGPSAHMVGEGISAKSAVGKGYASTDDSAVIAKNARGHKFARTGAIAPIAKSAEAKESVSMVESVHSARNVAEAAFAYTDVSAIIAKSVGGRGFVNTIEGESSAKNVGGAPFAFMDA
uniref:CNNM transmembrane domain-containing protein n=1 Tax=Chromera velia CCMP2878 TaxID=1169474 RepID=A0A0G4HCE8_9ALVE|eukprot:Cvel_6315.t1-p1 / transcript=Cvel_6315.t1 / gene=Cvel_6315 / organism=Chromera_velia_CCMP2878 / gene_product=DUF21 domain-containing protein At1g55930,, putative / transcript_product=DUF21 domain-containing protein At1g55930,, putative / location=Cvel_scaffold306:61260-71164(-) / protein_length=595 / sequence_SO=supercontig / SO=protein_coding / is_pseudo=false